MANKKCMVFETLANVQSMQVCEAAQSSDGLVRLSGVFGVCGVKNGNNRIYDKANYATMVEAMQKTIINEGCPGELEHPNTMNIDLNKVSHKIESIEMNEDGTITGTIALLNTSKGKEAQAIVEGGLPLYISSRGAGSIDESGHVTLTTIKTYDLVGTPGFSQAKLQLKKGQKFESLNESLEDGNLIYAIVEGDDLLGDDNDDKKKDDSKEEESKKKDDSQEEETKKKDDSKKEESNHEEEHHDDDNNKNSQDTTMNELKEAIDKLTEKITNLEAELHVAKESLSASDTVITELNSRVNSLKAVNYSAIEEWVKEQFAPDFKEDIISETQQWATDNLCPVIQNWVCEEFAPEVQNWVCEEFAPEVQGWITEEFAPEVQNWVCEEFAPEVQGWITEEFAPEVQNWVCEEFAPTVESWINEEFTPEMQQQLVEKQNDVKLSNIDALLESMETGKDAALELLKEQKKADKYAGLFCVEHMPAQYQPTWNTISEAKKDEIIRQSRAYDFTREGVLESFWSTIKFNDDTKQLNENKQVDPITAHQNAIVAQMMRLRIRH